MTQVWFNHLQLLRSTHSYAQHNAFSTVLSSNCQKLPDMEVLQADYSIKCYEDPEWWTLAVISMVGLIFVSFGVPIGMYLLMRHDWNREMQLVKTDKKSRVIAYRDFGRKYNFIASDFRPEAYYAESVDLVRKLFLSGVMSLIAKGTVFQNFCSVIFSMAFVMIHIKTWPYPFAPATLLKLFADLQVVLVALLGVALRFDDATLQLERFGKTWYGDAMFGLLVATAVPAFIAVVYRTPTEKVLHFLQKAARVDTSREDSELARNRLSLRVSRAKTEGTAVQELPAAQDVEMHAFARSRTPPRSRPEPKTETTAGLQEEHSVLQNFSQLRESLAATTAMLDYAASQLDGATRAGTAEVHVNVMPEHAVGSSLSKGTRTKMRGMLALQGNNGGGGAATGPEPEPESELEPELNPAEKTGDRSTVLSRAPADDDGPTQNERMRSLRVELAALRSQAITPNERPDEQQTQAPTPEPTPRTRKGEMVNIKAPYQVGDVHTPARVLTDHQAKSLTPTRPKLSRDPPPLPANKRNNDGPRKSDVKSLSPKVTGVMSRIPPMVPARRSDTRGGDNDALQVAGPGPAAEQQKLPATPTQAAILTL